MPCAHMDMYMAGRRLMAGLFFICLIWRAIHGVMHEIDKHRFVLKHLPKKPLLIKSFGLF